VLSISVEGLISNQCLALIAARQTFSYSVLHKQTDDWQDLVRKAVSGRQPGTQSAYHVDCGTLAMAISLGAGPIHNKSRPGRPLPQRLYWVRLTAGTVSVMLSWIDSAYSTCSEDFLRPGGN
jgi:hypothetical protein